MTERKLKKYKTKNNYICKRCEGRGLIQIAENEKGLMKCPNCKGTGVEECFITTKKAQKKKSMSIV